MEGWDVEHERDTDRTLLDVLYARHGRMVLSQITSWLNGDQAAAEDILQETLFRAWRNYERACGAQSVRGWLLTTARHLVIDAYRARMARPVEVSEAARWPTSTIADHADQIADSITVWRAVAALSDQHRSVLQETYLNGRSVAEAAAVLGIPAGTVKSRLHHARMLVRRELLATHLGDDVTPATSAASASAVTGAAAPAGTRSPSCRRT